MIIIQECFIGNLNALKDMPNNTKWLKVSLITDYHQQRYVMEIFLFYLFYTMLFLLVFRSNILYCGLFGHRTLSAQNIDLA